MREGRHSEEVRAVDMEMGGDDDMPGISQELTTDDIDDIALDPNLSLGERRQRLMALRDELAMRSTGDYMGDMRELSAHVADRLASLGNPQESETVADSTGMYPDDRSDDDDPSDHMDEES